MKKLFSILILVVLIIGVILLFFSVIAGLVHMIYVTNIDGIYNSEDKNRHPKSPNRHGLLSQGT